MTQKPRGALSNPVNRFDTYRTEAFDDGWSTLDAPAPELQTQVYEEIVKTLISYNKSPDISFDRSINPYRGCEHGCIYCFARPSHAYWGYSPGLDFESRLIAKPNAAAILEKELSKKTYRPEIITLGANTDPYQPLERERQTTRQILEVLLRYQHPVGIISKASLVLRDIDILQKLAEKKLVMVSISVTTLDATLARLMEPRAASPNKRLRTIRLLHEAGVPTNVLVAPVIPSLTDHEMEAILRQAADCGACAAGYVLLRLPHEIKELFDGWLERHFPDKKQHVQNLLRDMRGGKLYDSTFGLRMRGQGAYAQILQQRFHLATKKLNLVRWPNLTTQNFAAPSLGPKQLAFKI
jgi:DNA repair photolyase